MKYINEKEAKQQFSGYLRSCYGDIYILGVDYDIGYTLEEIDPIHYDLAFNDWLNSEGLSTDEKYLEKAY